MADTEEQEENSEESQKDIPLFRKEALQHRKLSYLGKSIIVTPISYSIWSLGFFIIAILLGLFLYFGKYAKRQEVRGILIPNKGLIQLYARYEGIVMNRYVQQGDKVDEGQLLYLISTEQHTLSEQGAFAQQIALLEKQLVAQKNQFAISEKNLAKYKALLAEHFVSETEYQKAYGEYLNLEISLHETEKKIIEVRGAGNYAIRAPAAGVVSTLVAMVGDRVTHDKALASIVPVGAQLQGMLFVPTMAIGFVKVGQKVLLKYDAYPYQNFGLYNSTVVRIDKSVLLPKDFDLPVNLSTDPKHPYMGNDPFYRVIVDLKEQDVNIYGKPYPLTPGMTLKGDMLGDERYIWQWILDPIYSLRGSLTS